MLELSSVLYIFVSVYAAGLLLPFLAPERAQFTAVTSVYRPLTLILAIAHCIAAYLSDLHFVLQVFASTAILLLPLSVRQELRDEPEKIFGTNPLLKMLWFGFIILCLVLFGRLFLGPSREYGYIIILSAILVQILLVIEIYKCFQISKSIHMFYAIGAALLPIILFIIRFYSIIVQDKFNFSLVDESEFIFLLRMIATACFFHLLIGITNFQFQKLWNKERAIRVDAERNSLDNLIALSIAQDNETGSRNLRKRKYVQALVDNLKSKGWFTMPDPDAHIDQLFSDSLSTDHYKSAADGPGNVPEGLGEQGRSLSDSGLVTVSCRSLES